MSRTTINVHVNRRRQYKLRNFLFDALMVAITGGLWLIWIFVREMRR
jgi:hypothetical protein